MENNDKASSNGKICYLEIPSANINQSVEFYSRTFGWTVRTRGDGAIAFDDGVGQVSGTWVTGRKPSAEQGIVISIMVDDAQEIVKSIETNGGKIVKPIGMDAPEITAWFSDPYGNVLGIYQEPV